MEQEDPKEPNSAFSDFLGAMGMSGRGKAKPEPSAETPEDETITEPLPGAPAVEAAETPEPAPQRETAPPIRKTGGHRKTIMALIALFAAGCAVWYFWPLLAEPVPPGEDVAASFNNRHITVSDLKDFIVLESGGRQDIEINTL